MFFYIIHPIVSHIVEDQYIFLLSELIIPYIETKSTKYTE